MHVFVIVRGQEDNLGDSVLRRPLVRMLRRSGVVLHALVGDNSSSYLESVGIGGSDVQYRSPVRWAAALGAHALRDSKTRVVLNAGEMKLDQEHNYLGWKLAIPLRLALARGCVVLQTGTGLRDPSRPAPRSAAKLLDRFALVGWRDHPSQAVTGVGTVFPDWAFSDLSHPDVDERIAVDRPFLTVTMRGDRAEPSAEWVACVKKMAATFDLRIRVATQVVRDSGRSMDLASRLECDDPAQVWTSDESHLEIETVVRDLYARSQIVVSDRLHALVIAASEGAAPVGLVTASAEKLTRTLAPVSLDGVCGTPAEVGRVMAELETLMTTEDALGSRLRTANESLGGLTDRVSTLLHGGDTATR